MTNGKNVFISHAFKDKLVADAFAKMLKLAGVHRSRIVYSSGLDTGLPTGTNLHAALSERLQNAGLVIELLSPTYFTRPMCLMELGAAWALNVSTYPIVLPPATRDDAKAYLGDVLLGGFDTEEQLQKMHIELNDRIREHLSINIGYSDWTDAAANFKTDINRVMADAVALSGVEISVPYAVDQSASKPSVSVPSLVAPATRAVSDEAVAVTPGSDELEGSAQFDYEAFDGLYYLGSGSLKFTTKWSESGTGSIHSYSDPPDLDGIALKRRAYDIEGVGDASTLDFTSRARKARPGDAVVVRNVHGNYAALLVVNVSLPSGDRPAALTLKYKINSGGSATFAPQPGFRPDPPGSF